MLETAVGSVHDLVEIRKFLSKANKSSVSLAINRTANADGATSKVAKKSTVTKGQQGEAPTATVDGKAQESEI